MTSICRDSLGRGPLAINVGQDHYYRYSRKCERLLPSLKALSAPKDSISVFVRPECGAPIVWYITSQPRFLVAAYSIITQLTRPFDDKDTNLNPTLGLLSQRIGFLRDALQYLLQ